MSLRGIRVRLSRQTGNPIDDERDAVGRRQGEREDDQPADCGFRNADFIQVTSGEIARDEKCDRRKREAQHPRTTKRLTQAILNRAGQYSLPLNEDDINISTVGRVLRVEVNYAMPVDLLVYSPELKFRLIGGGVLTE